MRQAGVPTDPDGGCVEDDESELYDTSRPALDGVLQIAVTEQAAYFSWTFGRVSYLTEA